ncbi:MAG: hypothetical protein ACOCX3_01470 [Chloroflexota bacterium]
MRIRRRTNLLWGIIPFAVGVTLLLNGVEAIPEGLYDVLQRAWPALLVVIGLGLLLRERVPFGSAAAVVITGGLVAGMVFVAYSDRSGQVRDDLRVAIAESVGDDITLLVVNLRMLDADLTLVRGDEREDGVTGTFIGSTESEISTQVNDSGAGTLEITIEETKPSQFPLLEAVGRGTLSVEIPPEVSVAVNVVVDDGLVTLNLGDVELERLTLNLNIGDAVVTLPAFQPRSLDPVERPGELIVRNGELTIFVPDEIDARIAFDRRGGGIAPVYDPAYIVQVDNVDGILRRDVESADIRLYYEVIIPDGVLTLEVIRD